ncbi:TPA: DUF6387 family protein [Raoultella terrigena]
MKRISSTKDLPKEFDLSKYEVLNGLCDKDLFRQLYLRIESYHDSLDKSASWDQASTTYFLEVAGGLKINYGQIDPFNEIKVDTPDEHYEWMKGGRDFYEKYMENANKSMSLSTGYGIGYLSRESLMYLSVMSDSVGSREGMPVVLDNDEFYGYLNEQSDPNKDGSLRARLSDSVTLVTEQYESLFLSVDLTTPDEILLAEFKRLIPIWRKEMNVEKNPSIASSWSVVKKKVIDYKIIPYIDLYIWANTNGVSIPHGIMAVALFPYGEKDVFSVTQTIKPFIENLMTFESLEKLRHEISI